MGPVGIYVLVTLIRLTCPKEVGMGPVGIYILVTLISLTSVLIFVDVRRYSL